MDDIDKVATDGPEQAIQILLDHQAQVERSKGDWLPDLEI